MTDKLTGSFLLPTGDNLNSFDERNLNLAIFFTPVTQFEVSPESCSLNYSLLFIVFGDMA